jgi:hypothetical protein
MKIPDKLAKEVKALRSTTDKKGRKMPLKIISKKANIPIWRVRFILYERKDIRVNEIKLAWMRNYREKEVNQATTNLQQGFSNLQQR